MSENTNRKQINANLARFIEAACKSKKLSLTKLAIESGLSKNYISMLKNGTLNGTPKIDTLKAIAETLQIEPEILLSKAGYSVERYYKPGLGETIIGTASELGLSLNLANSLADVVNAVMSSNQQEAIARSWFEDIIASYVYDQGHNKNLTSKEKEFYAGLGIELINYSREQKFNIEDIEI